MESIAWMAWTLPTAIFFVALACTLGVMTYLAAVYPEADRVGALRIPIAFVGTDAIATLPIGEEGFEISSLWLASVVSLVTAVFIFRTV